MTGVHIVLAILTGAFAVGSFVIAALQFKEKGPIFTNSYLLGTPQDREKLDKKAEYRLAATVFTMIGILFLLVAVAIVANLPWLFYLVIAGAVLLVVCVVVMAVKRGEFR